MRPETGQHPPSVPAPETRQRRVRRPRTTPPRPGPTASPRPGPSRRRSARSSCSCTATASAPRTRCGSSRPAGTTPRRTDGPHAPSPGHRAVRLARQDPDDQPQAGTRTECNAQSVRAQRCWRRTETQFRYPPRVRRPPKRTLRATGTLPSRQRQNDPPPVHTECPATLTRAERPARADRNQDACQHAPSVPGPRNVPPQKDRPPREQNTGIRRPRVHGTEKCASQYRSGDFRLGALDLTARPDNANAGAAPHPHARRYSRNFNCPSASSWMTSIS